MFCPSCLCVIGSCTCVYQNSAMQFKIKKTSNAGSANEAPYRPAISKAPDKGNKFSLSRAVYLLSVTSCTTTDKEMHVNHARLQFNPAMLKANHRFDHKKRLSLRRLSLCSPQQITVWCSFDCEHHVSVCKSISNYLTTYSTSCNYHKVLDTTLPVIVEPFPGSLCNHFHTLQCT